MVRKVLQYLESFWGSWPSGGGGGGGGVVKQGAKDGTAEAWLVDGSATTQPISAASLPLPTGASTEATLSTLNGKVPSQGQAAMAASVPVVIASNQSAVSVSVSGTATISGTVTANAGTNLNTSLLALEAGGNLASIKAKTDNIPAQGQALSAASLPVVLPAAQITTLTPPAAITNYANETGGNLATLAGGITSSKFQVNNATVSGTAISVNNGTTDAGTQRVTLSSDSTGQVALAAGTNLSGKVSAGQDTATIYSGTTALTPKFATISASSSGNNTVVAAVTSKKIRVVALQLMSSGTVNAKWQSDNSSAVDLTGLAYLIVNTGMVLPYNPVGWFETASGKLLNLNLSSAITVGGSITYIEV